MTLLPYPLTKILLPYDGSPLARKALELAAQLSIAGKEAVKGLTLLQVIGGSYLARHFHNVDLRVTRMDKDKDWQGFATWRKSSPHWRKGKSSSLWASAPSSSHRQQGQR
jgi:nucleotide-binding universal stress UspA family protein